MKSHFSLSKKITIMVTLITLVSSLFVGTISIILARKNLVQVSDQALLQAADSVAKQIEAFTESQFTLLEALSNVSIIRDDSVSLKEKCDALMTVVNMDKATYENIAFYDTNGNTYKADGSTMSLKNSAYFQASINGKKYVAPPALNPHTNTVLMMFSIPVYNYNHQICGVIVSIIKGNPYEDIIEKVEIGGGMHPVIVDLTTSLYIADLNPAGEGQDGTESQLDPDSEMGIAINNMVSGKTGTNIFYNPAMKQKLVASYKPVNPENPLASETPWTVFCLAPYDAYFSQMQHMIRGMTGTIIFFIVLGFGLTVLFAYFTVKPIKKVRNSIVEIATGNADLTQRIENKSTDEVGEVVESFNQFSDKLQNIMTDIKFSKDRLTEAGSELDSSAKNTEASIEEIKAGLDNMVSKVSVQNNSVTGTASAVNEISEDIVHLNKMIEIQGTDILNASASIEQMVRNINEVSVSMDQMAQSFSELSSQATKGEQLQRAATNKIELIKNQSETLQQANVAIANIAKQTNLLAMNAAIEASHAGEAGKGFAVVAAEIRKLSETSAAESNKIGNELKAIVESIEAMVQASVDSSEAFNSVNSKISYTNELVSQIKFSMEQQSEGSRNISSTLHSMNESSMSVRNASSDISERNKVILNEIDQLQASSDEIKNSVDSMTASAGRIAEDGKTLNQIVTKITSSIDSIGTQVDLFKV